MGMNRELSAKSQAILRMIAEGQSYEQILRTCPEYTYKDIFAAAREALDLLEKACAPCRARKKEPSPWLKKIRERHPRAYALWTQAEERTLLALYRQGLRPKDIAKHLQRRPSAIRSRIENLMAAEQKTVEKD